MLPVDRPISLKRSRSLTDLELAPGRLIRARRDELDPQAAGDTIAALRAEIAVKNAQLLALRDENNRLTAGNLVRVNYTDRLPVELQARIARKLDTRTLAALKVTARLALSQSVIEHLDPLARILLTREEAPPAENAGQADAQEPVSEAFAQSLQQLLRGIREPERQKEPRWARTLSHLGQPNFFSYVRLRAAGNEEIGSHLLHHSYLLPSPQQGLTELSDFSDTEAWKTEHEQFARLHARMSAVLGNPHAPTVATQLRALFTETLENITQSDIAARTELIRAHLISVLPATHIKYLHSFLKPSPASPPPSLELVLSAIAHHTDDARAMNAIVHRTAHPWIRRALIDVLPKNSPAIANLASSVTSFDEAERLFNRCEANDMLLAHIAEVVASEARAPSRTRWQALLLRVIDKAAADSPAITALTRYATVNRTLLIEKLTEHSLPLTFLAGVATAPAHRMAILAKSPSRSAPAVYALAQTVTDPVEFALLIETATNARFDQPRTNVSCTLLQVLLVKAQSDNQKAHVLQRAINIADIDALVRLWRDQQLPAHLRESLSEGLRNSPQPERIDQAIADYASRNAYAPHIGQLNASRTANRAALAEFESRVPRAAYHILKHASAPYELKRLVEAAGPHSYMLSLLAAGVADAFEPLRTGPGALLQHDEDEAAIRSIFAAVKTRETVAQTILERNDLTNETLATLNASSRRTISLGVKRYRTQHIIDA